MNCDGKLKDNDVSALMLHLAGKKPLTGASLIADAARLSPCKDDNEVLRKIDRKDCLFFI